MITCFFYGERICSVCHSHEYVSFLRQDHIMALQSGKKLIKAVEIAKHVVSELSSISSISCFDKEKCLVLENKLLVLNTNFQVYSTGSTFI